MPQQFYTNDFIGQAAPIRQSISSAASNLGTIAQAGIAVAQTNGQTDQQQTANQQDYEALKKLFEPTGVQVDWKNIAPRQGETNQQYRDRLKVETQTIGFQLKQMGFDPRELATAAKVPGIALETIQSLIQKRTAQDVKTSLSGNLPEGALNAIKTGQMPLAQINKTYGTNLSQEDYNKYAGIAEPAPFQHAPGTSDFKQAAAGDKPIIPTQQPISYSQGRAIVDNADLPAEDKKQFDPQLTTLADQQAAGLVTKDQTPIGYYAGMQKQGLPLTDLAGKVGGAMNENAKLKVKERAQSLQSTGQANARLRTLLQNEQFRARMRRDYGNDGAAAEKNLFDLTLKREQLDTDLINAMNYIQTDPSKPTPDPQSIMDQMVIIDNQISKLRSDLPNFDRLESDFTFPNRTTIQEPREVPPSTPPKQPKQPSAPNDPLGVR